MCRVGAVVCACGCCCMAGGESRKPLERKMGQGRAVHAPPIGAGAPRRPARGARARDCANRNKSQFDSELGELQTYLPACSRDSGREQAAPARGGPGRSSRAPIRGSSALLASESRPSPHPLVRVSTYCSRDGVASRRRASSARGPPPSDKPPTESFRMGKTPIGRQERNLKQGGDHAPQLSPCRIKTYRVFVLSDKTRYRL